MTAKDLKNALLQEAVQGKLVPQIAAEGNAKDLLEEIKKARHSELVSESKSKAKKEKSLPPLYDADGRLLNEVEVPFDIPENWCWCRLNDLCELIEDCPHSTAKDEGKGFPLIRTPNIGEGRLNFENVHRVSKKVYDERNFRAIPRENDLIFAREAPAGNIAVIQKGEIVCLGQRTVLIRPLHEILDSDFLAYYIFSPDAQKNLVYKAAGTTVAHVNMGDIRSFPIPLPPLAEQKRIVAATEKFMPLIEEYDKKESELKALNEQIGTLTKKAILQEAVQGRLVPQIATEGNAKDLLEEIRKERLSHGLDFANAKSGKKKLKKETALAGSNPCDIKEDEIPFDIPENWCWCRLGEICTKLVDGDHNPPAGLQEKTEYLMLSSRNINDDKLVDLDLVRYLSKEVFEKENERTKAEKGDIFFTSVGTLGRSCIFDGSINASFQRSVSIIKTEIFNYYLKYCLDSGYVQNFVVKNATGTAQKGFYLNQLAELLIPLPPLAEQKRIVAAIEKMLPLCEKLGE